MIQKIIVYVLVIALMATPAVVSAASIDASVIQSIGTSLLSSDDSTSKNTPRRHTPTALERSFVSEMSKSTQGAINAIKNRDVRAVYVRQRSRALSQTTELFKQSALWGARNKAPSSVQIARERAMYSGFLREIASISAATGALLTITDRERQLVEKDIITLQRDFTAPLQGALNEYLENDVRTTGKSTIAINTPTATGAIIFSRHASIVTLLTWRSELDVMMNFELHTFDTTIAGVQPEVDIKGSAAFNIKSDKKFAYFSLKDFTLTMSGTGLTEADQSQVQEILTKSKTLKGKAIKISLEDLGGSTDISPIQMVIRVNNALGVLAQRPLFAPEYRSGTGYILRLEPATLTQIARAFDIQDFDVNAVLKDFNVGFTRAVYSRTPNLKPVLTIRLFNAGQDGEMIVSDRFSLKTTDRQNGATSEIFWTPVSRLFRMAYLNGSMKWSIDYAALSGQITAVLELGKTSVWRLAGAWSDTVIDLSGSYNDQNFLKLDFARQPSGAATYSMRLGFTESMFSPAAGSSDLYEIKATGNYLREVGKYMIVFPKNTINSEEIDF